MYDRQTAGAADFDPPKLARLACQSDAGSASPRQNDTKACGVYFSANDAVLMWTRCFLASFRKYNPEMRLILIPFDDACQKTKALSTRFAFEIFDDDSFARLEAIGRSLELGHASYGPHWFRRYAAFWGPLERFAYLDARQVVLADLGPFVTSTSDFDLDLVYYDTAVEQVYAPGPLRNDFLRKGLARGFNSGRWASRRGLFELDDFASIAVRAKDVRDQLNPRNTDQAFFNFCCDVLGCRMAKIDQLLGDTVASGWARQPGTPYEDDAGVWRMWDHGGLDHKRRLLLMHWAGQSVERGLSNISVLRRFGDIPAQPIQSRVRDIARRSLRMRRWLARFGGPDA